MSDSVNGTKYTALPGQIPGTPINLGGVEYVLAPLNIDQVERFESIIPTLGQKPTLRENLDEAIPLIHACLTRNYPDITVEQVRGILDLGNFQTACAAIVRISGYSKAAPGELAPASP